MIILLFESLNHLLKAEKILKNNEIQYEIIPTPREYSSDCGSAIRVQKSSFKEKAVAKLVDFATDYREEETGVSTGLQNQ
ncbi:DUF3343 domain-containing protein [Candidatus Margulisiibacteriota bacterium]